MRIIDNSSAVLRAINDKIDKRLAEIPGEIVKEAKNQAPVKSGKLRDSIKGEVIDRKVVVGSTVPYGPAAEIRKPHLRPAIHGKLNMIKRKFQQ